MQISNIKLIKSPICRQAEEIPGFVQCHIRHHSLSTCTLALLDQHSNIVSSNLRVIVTLSSLHQSGHAHQDNLTIPYKTFLSFSFYNKDTKSFLSDMINYKLRTFRLTTGCIYIKDLQADGMWDNQSMCTIHHLS